jgi:dimeric dUTPase (all-alpha-NTP-PPase superfamily)
MSEDMPTFELEDLFKDRLEEMLNLQAKLQLRYHGVHPSELRYDAQKDYIRTMVLATTDELHEALRETAWKPWSSADGINHDAFKSELVDAFHFFMNLMLVANITADEFFNEYLRKNGINHGRIDDGYISPTG